MKKLVVCFFLLFSSICIAASIPSIADLKSIPIHALFNRLSILNVLNNQGHIAMTVDVGSWLKNDQDISAEYLGLQVGAPEFYLRGIDTYDQMTRHERIVSQLGIRHFNISPGSIFADIPRTLLSNEISTALVSHRSLDIPYFFLDMMLMLQAKKLHISYDQHTYDFWMKGWGGAVRGAWSILSLDDASLTFFATLGLEQGFSPVLNDERNVLVSLSKTLNNVYIPEVRENRMITIIPDINAKLALFEFSTNFSKEVGKGWLSIEPQIGLYSIVDLSYIEKDQVCSTSSSLNHSCVSDLYGYYGVKLSGGYEIKDVQVAAPDITGLHQAHLNKKANFLWGELSVQVEEGGLVTKAQIGYQF